MCHTVASMIRFSLSSFFSLLYFVLFIHILEGELQGQRADVREWGPGGIGMQDVKDKE